jgi:acyl-coenzyme A synthetase/AMP-(fatty) acid ligase
MMLSASIDELKLRELAVRFKPNFVWAPANRDDAGLGMRVGTYGTYGLFRTADNAPLMSDDLAVLMATSGSTGSPMMVRQTSRNLVSNASSIIESLQLTSDDRALTTLPMNYTYGLSIINSQLQCGGSLVVSDASMTDRAFWSHALDLRVTYFGGVPYTYEMLARLGVKRFKGSSVRMLTQAGGRLAPDLVLKMHSECKEVGIDFVVMYGQTEATARMSVLPSESVPDKPSSIGRPIPGGSFRVIDPESGREMGVGETGELEYSGPNVTLGYAENAQHLSNGDEFGGRLLTGDLARFDEDGDFFIVGRRKRFVKLFGNRISLDHVENHLRESGFENACTGVDDRLTVHVLDADHIDVILSIVQNLVTVHKSAIVIRTTQRIPRSDSGKILYSELEGQV